MWGHRELRNFSAFDCVPGVDSYHSMDLVFSGIYFWKDGFIKSLSLPLEFKSIVSSFGIVILDFPQMQHFLQTKQFLHAIKMFFFSFPKDNFIKPINWGITSVIAIVLSRNLCVIVAIVAKVAITKSFWVQGKFKSFENLWCYVVNSLRGNIGSFPVYLSYQKMSISYSSKTEYHVTFNEVR